MAKNIIVLDNGGSTIKTGLVTSSNPDDEPRIFPNAVIRSKSDKNTYIGHEFADCQDFASLHYRLPIEKGYVVDWDAQKAIWDGIFSDQVLNTDPTESALLITEPYFNLPNIREVYDQLIFEEYECPAYYRCSAASMIPFGGLFSSPHSPLPECMLIVDSGFSFTHAVPILKGEIVWSAVKRVDIGGKLLTNHLKELVSFRQWNMMEETYIMNHVKETCCFVSSDFRRDLEVCRSNPSRNPVIREYILPDQSKNKLGQVRQPDTLVTEIDQILVMNNERFTVPELLFRPDDIGLRQAGVAETIAHSISLLPPELQGMFWSNVGLIGGSTKFPGFSARLLAELQSLAPADWEVCIVESPDAVTEAYKSAFQFASRPEFAQRCVTRAEYAEQGSGASRRKFRDWFSQDSDREKQLEPQPAKKQTRQKGKAREEDLPSPILDKQSKSRSKETTASASTRRR